MSAITRKYIEMFTRPENFENQAEHLKDIRISKPKYEVEFEYERFEMLIGEVEKVERKEGFDLVLKYPNTLRVKEGQETLATGKIDFGLMVRAEKRTETEVTGKIQKRLWSLKLDHKGSSDLADFKCETSKEKCDEIEVYLKIELVK
jgi:hypothetical protein